MPKREETEPEPYDPVEYRRAKWRDYYYQRRDRIVTDKARQIKEIEVVQAARALEAIAVEARTWKTQRSA